MMRGPTGAQDWSGPNFKDRVVGVTAFLLHLLDVDGDGLIDLEEVRGFAKKFVTLAFVLFNTVLQAGMIAAAATVPPLFAMALYVKAQLVGGSADALQKEEMLAVLNGQVRRLPSASVAPGLVSFLSARFDCQGSSPS